MNKYSYSIRTIFLVLAFLLFTSATKSQVVVYLQHPAMNQLKAEDIWKIQLNNVTQKKLQVFLSGSIDSDTDGNILEATCTAFELNPGVIKLNVSDLPNISISYSKKEYEEMLVRTGSVPEGNYEICIDVIDVFDNIQLGSNCLTQNIAHINPPILVLPENEKQITLNEAEHLAFQWLQPSPLPSGRGLNYSLNLFEVLPNQSPEAAIRNNPTYYTRDGITATNYIYPISAPRLNQGSSYVWQVSAMKDDEPYGAPSEGAVVVVFTSEDEDEDLVYDGPKIISPADGDTVYIDKTNAKIDFKWENSSLTSHEDCKYLLKAVLLQGNQTTEDAIYNNLPFINEAGISGTYFQYWVSEALDREDTSRWDWWGLNSGTRSREFSWQVTQIDINGIPIGKSSDMPRATIVFKDFAQDELKTSKVKLVSPKNNSVIKLSVDPETDDPLYSNIKFTWSAQELESEGLKYNIKIVLIKKDQSPEDALLKNPPLIFEEGLGGEEYENTDDIIFLYPEYNPAHPTIPENINNYAWQIACIKNNESILSEINVFIVESDIQEMIASKQEKMRKCCPGMGIDLTSPGFPCYGDCNTIYIDGLSSPLRLHYYARIARAEGWKIGFK